MDTLIDLISNTGAEYSLYLSKEDHKAFSEEFKTIIASDNYIEFGEDHIKDLIDKYKDKKSIVNDSKGDGVVFTAHTERGEQEFSSIDDWLGIANKPVNINSLSRNDFFNFKFKDAENALMKHGFTKEEAGTLLTDLANNVINDKDQDT